MTTDEKISIVSLMADEKDEKTLLAYLNLAKSAVLRRAYPFDTAKTEVPLQYEQAEIEIAVYLLNKRGAEGEQSHSENGVSRSYESAGIPPSMLSAIIPMVGVL